LSKLTIEEKAKNFDRIQENLAQNIVMKQEMGAIAQNANSEIAELSKKIRELEEDTASLMSFEIKEANP